MAEIDWFSKEIFDSIDSLNTDRKHYRMMEQLESAVLSISNNIAEGKGRYSKKEFVQFLYIARGSLYETVSILNIFHKRNWIDSKTLLKFEDDALQIVRMLKGLITSVKGSWVKIK